MTVERTLPQDVELEQHVLGGIMVDPAKYREAASIIKADDFYLEGHGIIFELMGELSKRGILPDTMAVISELRDRGVMDKVGGTAVVAGMTAMVVSGNLVEAHARKLAEKSAARSGIHTLTEAIDELYRAEIEPEKVLGDYSDRLQALSSKGVTDTALRIADVGAEYWENLDNPLPAIPTGFSNLDWFMRGGMAMGTVVDVMARTTVGKSAFVLNVASHVSVVLQIPVLFFSLEMSASQLYERLLTSLTFEAREGQGDKLVEYHGVNNYNMRRNRLSKEELGMLQNAKRLLDRAPICIEDNSGLTPRRFKQMSRQFARKVDKGLIVVDYLQAMESDDPRATDYSRNTEVSRATRITARETGFPVLQAVQLNRATVNAGRPRMHHAEGAGKIEQDAYTVIVLDREDLRTDGENAQGRPTMPMQREHAPVAVAYLDKNRNGQAGSKLGFRYCGPVTRFIEDQQGG